MNRQAVQAAFARASTPTVSRGSTTTPARSFATSATRLEDDKNGSSSSAPKTTGRQRSEAAAARLAQMSARYKQSRTAKDNPGSLGSASFIRTLPTKPGAVDARTLLSAPSHDFIRSPLAPAPKILSFRSLPRKTGDAAGKPGLARRPVGFAAASGGSGARIGGGPASAIGSAAGGRPRIGGLQARVGGPGGKRTGGAGAGRAGGFRKRNGREARPKQEKLTMGKMTFSDSEKAVLDRLEKGEVVPFRPKLTPKHLSGYGPGIASDVALGQAENVIRTMRLMSGGQAYNAHSGVTVDDDVLWKRYAVERKPIFFNSSAEKKWLERAKNGFNAHIPEPEAKKVILDLVVLGKYKETEHVAINNVTGMISNYHNRTHTYKATDSKRFLDKVLSLLPAQVGKAAGAPTQDVKKA